MSYAWFICSGSKVTGPFTTEEVNASVLSGRLGATSFIWWKGQREWLPISFWQEHLQEIVESVKLQTKKAIWCLDIGTAKLGPLSQSELVLALKPIRDLEKVIVWAEGSDKRTRLLEMPDLMQLIGINRRDYERTPLQADVFTTYSDQRDNREYSLEAASISEGGIGIFGNHKLIRGDVIAMTITSDHLGGKLHVQGEVMYVTENGYAGVRFKKLADEYKAIISEYVSQFEASEKLAA